MRIIAAALALGIAQSPLAASAQAKTADIQMWRLDCGTIELSDTGPFSDTHLYDGQKRTLTDSCYLIRNGSRYLLWDTGFPAALKGQSRSEWVFTTRLSATIPEQLAAIGVKPEAVTFVGLSHYHDDHIGQARDFPSAELLIGRGDAEAVVSGAMEQTRAQLAPWLAEGASGKVTRLRGDHDVFGDGSVTVLAMHGHTPGHKSLLVRLPQKGPVLLTGDLYHFEEQIANRGVPVFNTDRADTLAAFHRFDQIATNLKATVIIQHDPRHVDRLPAFPASAR